MIRVNMSSSHNKEWSWKYILLFVGLVFFWAIENFILQASAFPVPPITKHPYFYQIIRLVLNLLGAAIILLILNRYLLIFIAILDCLLSLIIVAYNHYFHQVLSPYYAIKAVKEGLRVIGFAAQIIPPFVWALLIGALIIKIVWIFRMMPQLSKWRRKVTVLFIILFTGIVLALQLTSFKFTNIRMTTVKRAVYTYGYLISWVAECFVTPDINEVSKELIKLQSLSPDRLAKTEPPLPIGDKIVIIQLESFDFSILNCWINGREVTPYFNQLVRSSRILKVKAYHSVGTADMDFAVLSGGTPSSRVISYMVPGISYKNSLPRFLKLYGYHTVAWHGNNGNFFNRHANFQRMGFDEIWFKEDLKSKKLISSCWGVRDAEIFRLSSEKMHASCNREFHFIITLDSHGPFDLINDDEKEIFPHSQQWQQNYFNSMRVLDRDVKHYIESLPAETLVILYGDHTSGVNYGNFQSARKGSVEYVPCIIHVCRPLFPWPGETLPQVLIDDLRILDIINHLRHQIAQYRDSFHLTLTEASLAECGD
jgi:phosphoglycerol transferase MdoB-like AlkP superfamily enzyme